MGGEPSSVENRPYLLTASPYVRHCDGCLQALQLAPSDYSSAALGRLCFLAAGWQGDCSKPPHAHCGLLLVCSALPLSP